MDNSQNSTKSKVDQMFLYKSLRDSHWLTKKVANNIMFGTYYRLDTVIKLGVVDDIRHEIAKERCHNDL